MGIGDVIATSCYIYCLLQCNVSNNWWWIIIINKEPSVWIKTESHTCIAGIFTAEVNHQSGV